MNKRQSARADMHLAVDKHNEDNLEIIKTVPAYLQVHTEHKDLINALLQTDKRKDSNIEGVTTDKNLVRARLVNQCNTISNVVASHAAATKNNTLKKLVSYTYTKLDDMRDDKLASAGRIILGAARENLQDLGDYKVDAALLASFETLINTFDVVVSAPRNATSTRKTMGTSLVSILREANELVVERMDRLVLLFKESHPEFYHTYLNNRMVIDTGSRSTQLSGTIYNSVTGKPIRGVTIRVEGTEYKALTSKGGNYKMKVPVTGTYTLIAERKGFQPVIIKEVQIKDGQITRVVIEMVPAID